jgi:hypothetical protein
MMARTRGTGRVFTRGGSRWIDKLPSHVKVTDARNLLKKRLAEMEDGRHVAHQDRVVFGDLLDGLVIDYTNNGRRSIDTLTRTSSPSARHSASTGPLT